MKDTRRFLFDPGLTPTMIVVLIVAAAAGALLAISCG
jgi:hypothetical protein